jgi:hypothetical protein
MSFDWRFAWPRILCAERAAGGIGQNLHRWRTKQQLQ